MGIIVHWKPPLNKLLKNLDELVQWTEKIVVAVVRNKINQYFSRANVVDQPKMSNS